MRYVLLNTIAGLATLAAGLFHYHHHPMFSSLCLFVISISFCLKSLNRLEKIARSFLYISPLLCALQFELWQLMPVLAGIFMALSTLNTDRHPMPILKGLIGFSWVYFFIPAMNLISAILILLLNYVILEELLPRPEEPYRTSQGA